MSNFGFLSGRWPLLAKNGAYSEKYFYTDTNSSMLKLRLFAEELINYVLTIYNLNVEKNAVQKDKIDLLTRVEGINPGVIDLFHIIRINGNKAAHEAFSDMKEAAECLKAAFKLACWFYINITGDRKGLPEFTPPKRPVKKEAHYGVIPLEQYKKDLEEIRSAFEEQVSELKKQLESKPSTLNAEIKAAELPSTLGINESQTRKHLIDVLLKEAGWKLDNKESVYKEYPVNGLRTTRSGNGSIDYLLFDSSSNPVAVIEAKKTSRDPEEGKVQAKDYADAVEKKFGFRPVIFYTNGHETWMWDDKYAPPRPVWGFYTQSELERLFFRHKYGKPLGSVKIDDKIAGRSYQIEAIKSVLEKFYNNGRKALLVMATGTGKTRTVIALTKAMMEANQAKKVLFLADRDELVEQAMFKKNSFKTFMPEVPQVRVTASKSENREADLYFATYQAMISYYSAFGAGFFDLIICDESHRSIYNTYRDIIEYFDAHVIGLTATPVDYVSRNTYRLFQCTNNDPDFYYSFDEACDHMPPYLLRPRKIDATTDFLRRGIRWRNLDEEQKKQLEEEGYDEEVIDFDRDELDDFVYNDDTNRFILQNLMENGIKVKDEIGKSIIFARNIPHAKRLEKLFDELYPQYCGSFAAIIHSKIERCKTLIDDFKEKDKPRIVISVDMMDTGIDVPEIVNLVFAKPVYSKVKFLQMIGRGTRLCENLFAKGEDKKEFIIFDHWKNFEFFDMHADGKIPAVTKSTMQLLFEKKIALLGIFNNENDLGKRSEIIESIKEDLSRLPDKSVSVKKKYKVLEWLKLPGSWHIIDQNLIDTLTNEVAPLMQWAELDGDRPALWFDNQIFALHIKKLTRDPSVPSQEILLAEEFRRLRLNLNQFNGVREKAQSLSNPIEWNNKTYNEIEEIRKTFRNLMKYRLDGIPSPTINLDVRDGHAIIKEIGIEPSGMDMEAYIKRVKETLERDMSSQLVVRKIRKGIPLSKDDVDTVFELFEEAGLKSSLDKAADYIHIQRNDITGILRQFVGIDEEEINKSFDHFVKEHNGKMTSLQIRMLEIIKNDIVQNKGISFASLYGPPYTGINSSGIEGVFGDKLTEEVFTLIEPYKIDKTTA